MKHSQTIGIIASLLLVAVCCMPWIYVPTLQVYVSGLHGKVSNDLTLGRQIIPHSFFAVLMMVFFLIPKIWAKRTNMFIGFFNFGWALKNYIIFSLCRMGECPEKQWGLYLLVFVSLVMLLAALLPKLRLK